MLEISDILGKYPSSVSGGQQQRASLGRALVRDAGLYLLDEPMGQLEPQLRAVLRGRIKHYLREHNCTTILVTHDQTEANALADRIAVMEGGVLQQYATPAELKARPANLFTGTFIGEPPMNVFNADVKTGDGVSFTVDGGTVLNYPHRISPPPCATGWRSCPRFRSASVPMRCMSAMAREGQGHRLPVAGRPDPCRRRCRRPHRRLGLA